MHWIYICYQLRYANSIWINQGMMATILFLTLKLFTKFIRLNKIIVMFEHGQLTFLTIWYCHELLVIINESRKGSEMRLHLFLLLKTDIIFIDMSSNQYCFRLCTNLNDVTLIISDESKIYHTIMKDWNIFQNLKIALKNTSLL